MLRRADSDAKLAQAYVDLAVAARQFGMLPIAPFRESAIRTWRQIKRMRLNVESMEFKIAAIASELDAAVGKRNVRDFGRVPGLRIED